MRMAYICADPGVPVFGTKGCSVHAREVISALRRARVEVVLYASRFGGPVPAGFEDLEYHALPRATSRDAAEREQCAIAGNSILAKRLANDGPFNAVYERHSLFSTAGMQYAAEHEIAGILEVNAPLIDEQKQHRSLVHEPAAIASAADAFDAARAIIAVSPGVADYVAALQPSSRGRIHVIPNGVNQDRFNPDVTPAIPALAGKFVVGFAGSMKPWHGLELLVDAFEQVARQIASAHLLIVGDGPLSEPISNLLATRKLPATLTGPVPMEQMPGMLTSMDVALAPYPARPDFYFSPLKIVEYMAAGRAVVASDIGSINHLISTNVSGVLVPPGDVQALSDAIGRLVSSDLRDRLGAAARQTVVEAHTWDHVAAKIIELASSSAPATQAGQLERC